MSTNTNSQRENAIGALLPAIPRERGSSKHSARTARRTIKYIRLGGQAARQPPVETDQDVGSILRRDSVCIEYRDQVPVLILRPRLYQVIQIKTFAAMRRDGEFPDVYAKSGWGHNQVKNFDISGKHWTTEVMNLCRRIKFSLEPNLDCDQGVPGQYNASHAEKQLIAYLIHKHVFLPREVNNEEESESKSESADYVARLLEDLTLASENKQTAKDKLIEQWKPRPQQPLNRAVIFVSRPMCSDCERFLRHVQDYLDLEIKIQSVQAVCSSA